MKKNVNFDLLNMSNTGKQNFVNKVFHDVAEKYDLMNDLMSGGMHRLWKNAMVDRLNPPKLPGWKVLDIGGGTGDIAFRIVEASQRNTHVTVADISQPMISIGQERAESKGLQKNISFLEANAEELPFPDESFDACTTAFCIRNVADRLKALKEIQRVLKIGSRFLCLEFSQVDLPLLDRVYDLWSLFIPKIGQFIVGNEEPYRYLVESIRQFPNQKKFSEILKEADFKRIRFDNYAGGVATLYSSWKL